MDLYEFKASLIYRVSSRRTQRNKGYSEKYCLENKTNKFSLPTNYVKYVRKRDVAEASNKPVFPQT